CQKYSSFPFSF
nr:immunoglobulin light chain junction region [Macaca mulatta]